jgi:hypothetical protein
VKGGELVEGQGTERARVKHGDSTVIVKVAVTGLPGRCPSTFTVDAIREMLPEPVKIFELQPDVELAENEIAFLVSEHTKNPNNQIYILVGYFYGKASPEILQKQAGIRASLVKAGIPCAFITFKGVYAEAELMQFWRVPPGANNPTCKECEKLAMNGPPDCPKISIAGPAGVTNPGDRMTFTTSITGNLPENVRLRWSVIDGEIYSGQGTLNLTVRAPNKSSYITTATLKIEGLPVGCPNTASESAPVSP